MGSWGTGGNGFILHYHHCPHFVCCDLWLLLNSKKEAKFWVNHQITCLYGIGTRVTEQQNELLLLAVYLLSLEMNVSEKKLMLLKDKTSYCLRAWLQVKFVLSNHVSVVSLIQRWCLLAMETWTINSCDLRNLHLIIQKASFNTILQIMSNFSENHLLFFPSKIFKSERTWRSVYSICYI